MHDEKGELRCDMKKDCKEVVTHIDDKGYAYCRPHGIQRQSYRRCRMLTPGELKQLKAGKPLAAY